MKRFFDILFSLVALLILFIPFIIIAILIKVDSKGRIFFVQQRVGRNGIEFSLYKFRTMSEGADHWGMLTVGERDSRITRIGFYLRKYKLDELPQFLNVLKGDMSMVGPRPEVKKYVDLYSEEQRKILTVRPGITDIASIQFAEESEMLAKYANAEEAYVREIMPTKISLSLGYLRNQSFASDMVIMAKTVSRIFSPLTSRKNLETVLLSLLAFSLPFYEKVSAALAVTIAVFRIFNKKIIDDAKPVAGNILASLFIVYYVAHLAGTLYSANLDYAFFDLQIKLPFLFFPLLLLVPLARPEVLKSVKIFFIAGCSIASLICLLLAVIQYSGNHDPFDFFYIEYSAFLHVSYFSIYLNLCILFLADGLIRSDTILRSKVLNLILLVFLFLTVILLFARTALFTCFVTVIGYSIISGIHRKMPARTYLAIVLLSTALIAAAVFSNHVYNRFSQVAEEIQNKKTEELENNAADAGSYNSVSTRIELWKDSWELIKQDPWFGVGTGDIKDALKQKYAEERFYYGAESRFNPHNQFLHTGVALGLMGVIILVMLLTVPAALAWREKNYLFVTLCVMIVLNCMTESVLEVQKGVLFFSVFGLLLFNANGKNKKPPSGQRRGVT